MLRERTTNPHVLSSLAKLLANHAQDTNLWPQLETFLCFFQDHYSIPCHTKQPTICHKKVRGWMLETMEIRRSKEKKVIFLRWINSYGLYACSTHLHH